MLRKVLMHAAAACNKIHKVIPAAYADLVYVQRKLNNITRSFLDLFSLLPLFFSFTIWFIAEFLWSIHQVLLASTPMYFVYVGDISSVIVSCLSSQWVFILCFIPMFKAHWVIVHMFPSFYYPLNHASSFHKCGIN